MRTTLRVMAVLIFSSLSDGCAAIPTLEDIILRPTPDVSLTPAGAGFPFTEMKIPVTAQREISIWQGFAPGEPRGVVVILPGSDRNKSRYVPAFSIFLPLGFDLIVPDYAGFGESPGEPSFQNVIEDAAALAEFAKNQHETVVLFGASLGTPLAIHLASEGDYAAVILEATLILLDEAEFWLRANGLNIPFLWHAANFYIYPQTPPELNTLLHLPLVDEPKLFLHSIEDDVVPFEAGLLAFDTAVEPKELWEMRGEHGKMVEIDFEAYRDQIADWLNRTLPPPP